MIYLKHNKYSASQVVGMLLFAWSLARTPASALADQIVVKDRNINGISVNGIAEAELTFRGSDGNDRHAPLTDVRLIFIDQVRTLSDFNEAERLVAEGQFDDGIVRYKRAQRLAESFWLDLIEIRIARAYESADRFDEAFVHWLNLVSRPSVGPTTAARLIPSNIPTRRTVGASAALEAIDAALKAVEDTDRHTVMSLARFEILGQSGDGRASDAASEVVKIDIAKPLRCPRLYAILLGAFEIRNRQPADAALIDDINQAISTSPESLLPSFLLLKGDALLQMAKTRDDVIRASWPYMHVLAMKPTDERAADALFRTAQIVEQIGRPQKAAELLNECIAHRRVTPKTRRKAKAVLARLNGVSKGGNLK